MNEAASGLDPSGGRGMRQSPGRDAARPGRERGSGARRSRSVTVVLPSALRELAGDRGSVALEGAATVGEALARLRDGYPALHDRIVDERGRVREHINLFVGAEDVRWTGGLETPVPEGGEVFVIRSVSGG